MHTGFSGYSSSNRSRGQLCGVPRSDTVQPDAARVNRPLAYSASILATEAENRHRQRPSRQEAELSELGVHALGRPKPGPLHCAVTMPLSTCIPFCNRPVRGSSASPERGRRTLRTFTSASVNHENLVCRMRRKERERETPENCPQECNQTLFMSVQVGPANPVGYGKVIPAAEDYFWSESKRKTDK